MRKTEKTQLIVSKILEAAMNEFGKKGYSSGTINYMLYGIAIDRRITE